MTRVLVAIPDDLTFADLRLGREPDGSVSYDPAIVTRICEASGLDPALMHEAPEDNVAGLIVAWYASHLAGGGAPDPVAEQISAEVRAEDHHEGMH